MAIAPSPRPDPVLDAAEGVGDLQRRLIDEPRSVSINPVELAS